MEVPGCVEGEEESIFKETKRNSKISVPTKSPRNRFISEQSSWFLLYIGMPCGIVHDRNMEKISSDWKSIDKIGKSYHEGRARSAVSQNGGGREVGETKFLKEREM